MSDNRNTYLDRVVANQERLEQDLRVKRAAPMAAPNAAPAAAGGMFAANRAPAPPPMPRGSSAVEVRVTGRFRWRTVVVPPNAFVVHTRRGYDEPLHVGLGKSFRFNPLTDSYLVVPGAMQTILISAFSICRELQGCWSGVRAVDHPGLLGAYRKLDFGDPDDRCGWSTCSSRSRPRRRSRTWSRPWACTRCCPTSSRSSRS